MLIVYFTVALVNVYLHILRGILVIKSSKLKASLANCVCYTFSAVVVKFIAEVDIITAIIVQATTNFAGCYVAMWVAEKLLTQKDND